MKNTVIIHSGYYEMLALSSMLDGLKLKLLPFSSLKEFYDSGIGMGVDCIIIEARDMADDFNTVMKFIRRMSFFYNPPRLIVMTKVEQPDKLSLLADENIDMLISEQEALSVVRKMLITGVTDLSYQMALSPCLKEFKYGEGHSCKKHLTTMEWQVLSEIKQMKSNACVAKKMGKSCKTISTHKRNAMKKLGLRNTIDLYKYLMQ